MSLGRRLGDVERNKEPVLRRWAWIVLVDLRFLDWRH